MSSDAQALEQIAMSYIDALLTADDSKVPLAADKKRAHLMVLPGAPYAWQMAKGPTRSAPT